MSSVHSRIMSTGQVLPLPSGPPGASGAFSASGRCNATGRNATGPSTSGKGLGLSTARLAVVAVHPVLRGRSSSLCALTTALCTPGALPELVGIAHMASGAGVGCGRWRGVPFPFSLTTSSTRSRSTLQVHAPGSAIRVCGDLSAGIDDDSFRPRSFRPRSATHHNPTHHNLSKTTGD
jgi:hypothetical protein